jgi:hypothetical protein
MKKLTPNEDFKEIIKTNFRKQRFYYCSGNKYDRKLSKYDFRESKDFVRKCNPNNKPKYQFPGMVIHQGPETFGFEDFPFEDGFEDFPFEEN